MSDYDPTNKGTIARNKNKTEPTHSDLKGQINIEGVDYWIDGYERKNSKDGSTFYSLKATPKQAKPVTAAGQSYAQASGGGYKQEAPNKWTAGLADLKDGDLPF